MSFTYRPPSFLRINDDRFKHEVDKAVSQIYDAHGQLDFQAVKGPGSGFKFTSGSVTVTGSKTSIATGLATVEHVVASLDGGTATNQWVSARVHPSDTSKIDVFVWKPTSSGDNTPIASTTAVTVRYFVTGT